MQDENDRAFLNPSSSFIFILSNWRR